MKNLYEFLNQNNSLMFVIFTNSVKILTSDTYKILLRIYNNNNRFLLTIGSIQVVIFATDKY